MALLSALDDWLSSISIDLSWMGSFSLVFLAKWMA